MRTGGLYKRRSKEKRAPSKKSRAEGAKSRVVGVNGRPVTAAASRSSSSSSVVGTQVCLRRATTLVRAVNSFRSICSVDTPMQIVPAVEKARGGGSPQRNRASRRGSGLPPRGESGPTQLQPAALLDRSIVVVDDTLLGSILQQQNQAMAASCCAGAKTVDLMHGR